MSFPISHNVSHEVCHYPIWGGYCSSCDTRAASIRPSGGEMMWDAGRAKGPAVRCTAAFRHRQGGEAGYWLADASNRLITCRQGGGVNLHFIGRGTTLDLHDNVSQQLPRLEGLG
ncbi:hypothetical protein P171DRAFT_50600 [Karstenula rhodostoma CBS 690.94]|uniref:Uncharacterized protein n=1 Tax=Karstenula rhodostoma CBS 690.94 TaxID=1392251 RepID=A0A9P4PGB7_9PLEO|nr:hypothetical protein P171DRAFT_50600 [Karstenula rhodostoma CBS 690.94]